MTGRGRASFTLLVTMAAVAAVVLPAALVPSAAQATSYRYWSYWVSSSDQWTYASQGAGSLRPKDGSVQGWRFAISQGASSSTTTPRIAPSFASLCQGVEATAGTRRVGLVIDYGITADAPSGELPRATERHCVRIADGGTGLTVLSAVASIRAKAGLVCGISGYPKAECTAIVKQAPAAPPAPRPSASAADPDRTTSSSSSSANGIAKQRSTPGATAPTTSADRSAAPSTPTPAGAEASPNADTSIDVIDATQTSAVGPSGNPVPTAIALALVVAIAAFVLVKRRRRS